MKIRVKNLFAAVGELRSALLALRNLSDTLLSFIDVADATPSSKRDRGHVSASMPNICLDQRRADGVLAAFALATVIVLVIGKEKGRK